MNTSEITKIAIISDIHANLPALKAVLKDIDSFKTDQIYCLGDLTDGAPWHNEVIELIRGLRIPTIMGNHDERITFNLPVTALAKHDAREREARFKAINFTKDTILQENKQFLEMLPRFIQLSMGNFKLLLTHGSTRGIDEYIYESHDENDLLSLFSDQQIDVLIVGHTHLSFVRELENGKKMVINAGSVGRTKEKDGLATYLQLTIKENDTNLVKDNVKAVIRKVEYPVNETIEGIRKSPIPDFYADFLANNSNH